ncbi:MAG: hypothetical protein FWC91_11280 [Defluviitaleaceae bacterium]|nr:hypothetical protein [Defluviitaleaceae bacterium]
MHDFIGLFVGAFLVQNVVLASFLGICPLLGVSKKQSSAFGMGVAVLFVIMAASVMTFAIYHNILAPFNLQFMRTIVFVLINASFVQFVEMFIKKFMPPLYKSLGIFLPLMATNCAILGAVLINIDRRLSFGEAMVNAFGISAGFLLIIFIFSTIRERLELSSNIPKGFKGIPIALLVVGIMSIAFAGFAGMGS